MAKFVLAVTDQLLQKFLVEDCLNITLENEVILLYNFLMTHNDHPFKILVEIGNLPQSGNTVSFTGQTVKSRLNRDHFRGARHKEFQEYV